MFRHASRSSVVLLLTIGVLIGLTSSRTLAGASPVRPNSTATESTTSTTTTTANTALDAPTNVTYEVRTGTSATTVVVAWSPPVSSAPVTAYRAEAVSTSGRVIGSCQVAAPTSTCHFALGSVAALASVEVRVATPVAGPPSVPGQLVTRTPAPLAGLTVASGATGLVITWAPPTPTQSAVSGYAVNVVGISGASGGQCATTSTTCVISTLTPVTPYRVVAVATNAAGTSVAVSRSPVEWVSAPTHVITHVVGDDVHVTWTAPNTSASPGTYYLLTSSPTGLSCHTTVTSCDVANVPYGTAYRLSVTRYVSTHPSTPSLPSAPVTVTTNPSAPLTAHATLVRGRVVVTWRAPTQTGGLVVRSYVVTSVPAGHDCTSVTTTCQPARLVPGQTYHFAVRASNAHGLSPAGFTTPVTDWEIPGAPRSLHLVPGPSGVVLSWNHPPPSPLAPLVSYAVLGHDASGATVVSRSVTSTTITVPLSSTPSSYSFIVRTIGPAGYSVPASTSLVSAVLGPFSPDVTGLSAQVQAQIQSAVKRAVTSHLHHLIVTSYAQVSANPPAQRNVDALRLAAAAAYAHMVLGWYAISQPVVTVSSARNNPTGQRDCLSLVEY